MDQPKSCSATDPCQRLRQLLAECVEDTEIMACPQEGDWPCQAMLHNARLLYQRLTPSVAAGALQLASDLFGNPAEVFTQDVRKLLQESPFHCPDLNLDIYQPCQTTSCEFYTPNKWTRNCILYYQVRHDRDVLNLNELAFLRDSDINTLRMQVNRALKGLGKGALKEKIVQEGIPSQVTHLNVDKICVVCEKNVALAKGHHLIRSGLTYCSRECYQQKPPVVIEIEKEIGLPIIRVLQMCIEQFASVKNICGVLGVGHGVFLDLCQRYGVDLSNTQD